MSKSQQKQIANISDNSKPPVVNNTALIVEGGGQRGIFTAGVLDSWLAQDFNPFSLLIGTSAGAQNLSTYMTRQPGHAKQSIMQLSSHPDFFNMKRSFSGRHAMDLDWYFKQSCSPEFRLNIDCALTQLKDRQLLFSATKVDGLSPIFIEPTENNWLTALKASSAIPYLYKKGVEIDNQHYVDGGVVLPIPVQEAYKRGAKKIIVIRTTQSALKLRSPWAHKLKEWVCKKQTCPKVLDIITVHENAYNDALDFIRNPPEDAQVIEIAPAQKLASRVLGSSNQALTSDYQMGYEIGNKFLQSELAELFKAS